MSAQDIESEFPKLRHEGYRITSSDTSDYNCFAWAVYDTTDWWSPLPINGYYWPDELPRNTTLQTFIELYRLEGGFVPCDNGDPEDGFEKVALYIHTSGNVTHAARQIQSGAQTWIWTSKLGVKEDVEHTTLTGLEDAGMAFDDYGKVVQFLKRPRTKVNE